MKHQVAVIIGSNRAGSFNQKLAIAIEKLGSDRFEFHNIKIDNLPLYTQDLEHEKPAAALAFVEEMKRYKNLLVVTPEHNRSIPTLLKNAIDWGSRPAVGGSVWKNMIVATAGTSPGALGTALAQQHLRHIFLCYGKNVMGGELYLQMKDGLIDDIGNVTNPDTEKFLKGFVDRFVEFIETEHGGRKMAA